MINNHISGPYESSGLLAFNNDTLLISVQDQGKSFVVMGTIAAPSSTGYMAGESSHGKAARGTWPGKQILGCLFATTRYSTQVSMQTFHRGLSFVAKAVTWPIGNARAHAGTRL